MEDTSSQNQLFEQIWQTALNTDPRERFSVVEGLDKQTQKAFFNWRDNKIAVERYDRHLHDEHLNGIPRWDVSRFSDVDLRVVGAGKHHHVVMEFESPEGGRLALKMDRRHIPPLIADQVVSESLEENGISSLIQEDGSGQIIEAQLGALVSEALAFAKGTEVSPQHVSPPEALVEDEGKIIGYVRTYAKGTPMPFDLLPEEISAEAQEALKALTRAGIEVDTHHTSGNIIVPSDPMEFQFIDLGLY